MTGLHMKAAVILFAALIAMSCEQESRKNQPIELKDKTDQTNETNKGLSKSSNVTPSSSPASTVAPSEKPAGSSEPPQGSADNNQDGSGMDSPKAEDPQKGESELNRSCPDGSVPAVDTLKTCCSEKGWGESCNGPCWKEGVPEALAKLCQPETTPIKDCGESPKESDTKAWCDFHHNRRYCGVSDTDWLAQCK